jgi:hypothetical protein
MILALAWSAIPSVFLGRAKLPLAAQLDGKVLYTALGWQHIGCAAGPPCRPPASIRLSVR